MAVNVSKLRESKFWNRKIDRFVRVQDVDNSGDISRADFDLITKRYKQMCISYPEKAERYSKHKSDYMDRLHLTDESAKLSYAEFKESIVEDLAKGGKPELFLQVVFSTLDLNDDGVISFEEWKTYYYCMGIDQAHAQASFDAMDANSDGEVSKDEFVNFLYEYFFTTENKLGSAILYGPLE